MIICSCNVISDHEVRDAADRADTLCMSQVYRILGRKPECGRCQRTIKETVRKARNNSNGAHCPR